MLDISKSDSSVDNGCCGFFLLTSFNLSCSDESSAICCGVNVIIYNITFTVRSFSSFRSLWLQMRLALPITCSILTGCQYGSVIWTQRTFRKLIPSAPEAVIISTLIISPIKLFPDFCWSCCFILAGTYSHVLLNMFRIISRSSSVSVPVYRAYICLPLSSSRISHTQLPESSFLILKRANPFASRTIEKIRIPSSERNWLYTKCNPEWCGSCIFSNIAKNLGL